MEKSLKNTFLGFLGIGVLITSINFNSNLNKVLKTYIVATVEMTSEVYQAYNKNTLSYSEYLLKIKSNLDQNKKLNKDLWDGKNGFPDELKRKKFKRNLYNGYKVEEKKGKFQVDLEILENFTLSDWKSFNGSEKTKNKNTKERFSLIQKIFSNIMSNLYETQFSLQKKQDKLKDYNSLPYADKINIPNQISVNEYTLTESYKLVEWYKSLIILRLEQWRLINPKDSKIVEKEFNNLIFELTRMNFNLIQ